MNSATGFSSQSSTDALAAKPSERTALPIKFLLFDLREVSTGRTFRIWSNGELEGFAEETQLMNHGLLQICAMLGALMKARLLSEEVCRIVDRVQADLSDPSVTGVGSQPFWVEFEQALQAQERSRG